MVFVLTTLKSSDMTTIKFVVPTEPIPFPRPRFNSDTKGVYNSARYTAFKNAIGLIARRAMDGREPFTGEIKIHADFYRHKPRPKKGTKPQVSFIGDGDNYLKAVMDALIGICYVDDRQITDFSGRKIFGNPHVEIELEEITQ